MVRDADDFRGSGSGSCASSFPDYSRWLSSYRTICVSVTGLCAVVLSVSVSSCAVWLARFQRTSDTNFC